MSKMVYLFEEGNADMRNLLGGKGANLAEMTNLGLPIPQGFTVTTEACTDYYNNGRTISEDIQQQIFTALADLEKKQGKKFGDTENPLLVSVRSGARASMPGMMDTILNLGLNDVAVEGFAKKTGNPRFAYDSYRRFIQMFSDVVMEVPKSLFERVLDEIKAAKQVKFDMELTAEDLQPSIPPIRAKTSSHTAVFVSNPSSIRYNPAIRPNRDWIRSLICPSIQEPSTTISSAVTRILGTKVRVCSWIWVAAWKIATISPTTILAIRIGAASLVATSSASRNTSNTSA